MLVITTSAEMAFVNLGSPDNPIVVDSDDGSVTPSEPEMESSPVKIVHSPQLR